MAALVLLVELEITPGQMAAFKARAAKHRDLVLANEPGCHRFELLAPADDDSRVFLYEVYADQAAIDHHLGTDYMKQYLEDTGPMIAKRNRTLCETVLG